MGRASRILRSSIFTFLKNFHLFSSTPAFLAAPFAAIILLSQNLVTSSSLFVHVHDRMSSLFLVAGFPAQFKLFTILNLKLCQTAISYLISLPFTLSFLLLAKSCTITILKKNTSFSWIRDFITLPITQLCTSFVLFAANATCFCILLICLNLIDFLGLSHPGFKRMISAGGIIFYSIVLANASVICNLSLIISWIEKRGGFTSILKACFLIQGKTATALSLTVCINMGLAAMEALFQYRIATKASQRPKSAMVLEGIILVYIYSLLLILDTIVGYMLLKSMNSC